MSNSLLELAERYNQTFIDTNRQEVAPMPRIVASNATAISCSPLVRFQHIVVKRFFDLLISALAILFLLSWLIPILALLIKFDSVGPVFFVQKRDKRDGKSFSCLKLRTMVVNAESDTLPATINDQRITSLGKFLRRSHLDELPQFVNVLLGDMSIIGPRPHMCVETIKFSVLYHSYPQRHAVKPGITGLAQSLGYHGPITDLNQLEKKIECDIFYIHHWSLALDVKILINTVKSIYRKLA